MRMVKTIPNIKDGELSNNFERNKAIENKKEEES